jgi:hypothetical protein
MKNIALALVITAASTVVLAGWEDAGSNDFFKSYADPATIRKSGSVAKMWSLMDFKKATHAADGQFFRSVKNQAEYDCKGERSRILYSTYFKGAMGAGETLGTSRNSTMWEPVSPESVAQNLWNYACMK